MKRLNCCGCSLFTACLLDFCWLVTGCPDVVVGLVCTSFWVASRKCATRTKSIVEWNGIGDRCVRAWEQEVGIKIIWENSKKCRRQMGSRLWYLPNWSYDLLQNGRTHTNRSSSCSRVWVRLPFASTRGRCSPWKFKVLDFVRLLLTGENNYSVRKLQVQLEFASRSVKSNCFKSGSRRKERGRENYMTVICNHLSCAFFPFHSIPCHSIANPSSFIAYF